MRPKTMSKFLIPFLCLIGTTGQSKILRSAALYYTPKSQIETNLIGKYEYREFTQTTRPSHLSATTVGMNLEYGIADFLSAGANFTYGLGQKTIEGSSTTKSLNTDVKGFTDPSVYVKSHFQGESLRFHANGLVKIKSDVLLLSSDYTPENFSEGASSFALNLGLEGAIGPTTLGFDVSGDLWRDTADVVLKQANKSETSYFQEGGQKYGFSFFGELSQFRWIKPGARIGLTKISGTKYDIQTNEVRTGLTPLRFNRAEENLIETSLYGRIKLPSRFVLDFEVAGSQSNLYESANGNPFNSLSFQSNLGVKF